MDGWIDEFAGVLFMVSKPTDEVEGPFFRQSFWNDVSCMVRSQVYMNELTVWTFFFSSN